jgi:hypothetical protein
MAELKPVLFKKGDKLTIGKNDVIYTTKIKDPLFLFIIPVEKQQQLAEELKKTVYYSKEVRN